MSTILDEIVDARKESLHFEKSKFPEAKLRSGLGNSDRDFAGALRRDCPAFILECKKASPSKGLIREPFDLAEIAAVYGQHATAISVLTEPEYFQGSIENLKIMRSLVKQPLICKDFIIEPYQVYSARRFGADAILLILAILNDDEWKSLFALAQSLGMDAVTEVSNEDEQKRAVALQAPIVGINNRNLRDMSIDLETTRRLAKGLPEGTIVISESGYHTNQQVREMTDCSDGYLIGSSLMGQPDLDAAVRGIIFGENKVCGLTRNEDAQSADGVGAVFGGVIFAEKSPRCVALSSVEDIFDGTSLIRVGVFQDHGVEFIESTLDSAQLQVVQLHGDETTEFVSKLRASLEAKFFGDVLIWRALPVSEAANFESWFAAGADRIVVDQHPVRKRAGQGRCLIGHRCRNRIVIS